MRRVKSLFFIWLLATGMAYGNSDEPMRISFKEIPQKIHHQSPVYPQEAISKRIQGAVALEVTLSTVGDVVGTEVIPTDFRHPLLEQAAQEAVMKWKYKPYIDHLGKARSVIFTAIVTFKLQESKSDSVEKLSSEKTPKKIKDVRPEYPPEAIEKGIEGKVVLECLTDTEGNVVETRVVREQTPSQPLLEAAAIKAVKNWKYQPYIGTDGKPKAVKFTVDVTFSLKH